MLYFFPLLFAIGFVFQHCDGFQDAFGTNDHEFGQILITNEDNPVLAKNVTLELDPEAKMNVIEMIRYNGYPAEEYDITTEDGYIITIQRIPYGRSGPGNKTRQPVIVQHGLFCTSIVWVFNTPIESIGFMLADNGYDVWLSNIRGSTYGRRHKRLSPKQKEFWDFSFDEMGRYDMPAIIDFVLTKTGFSQTNYIGHSMGTTLAFVMFSERPEYNNKVRSAMLMAPVISAQHMTSSLIRLKPYVHEIQFVVNLLGGYEVLPQSRLNKFLSIIASDFCDSPIKEICEWLPVEISGFDAKEFNVTRFPVYVARTPGGASLQTIMHYAQLMDPGFRRYDYGKDENIRKYGQAIPPMYSMNNITAHIALFWSDSDMLADPTDVALLAPQISNLVLKYRVPYTNFTHIDYIWAVDVKRFVYNKVMQTMKKLWPDE